MPSPASQISQKSIRIFLVENHTLVRAGMRALMEQLPDITVIGEAGDGAEALAQLSKLPADSLPDIILMDLAMSGMGGLEATEKIKQAFPPVRVLILSMHSSEEYVLQALRVGASGYLLKDAAPGELVKAMQNVMQGEISLSPAVSRHVITDYLRRVGAPATLPASTVDSRILPQALTPRQREILPLIAKGMSTKEIATHLGVSVKTVETHRAALMERLGLHDITGLVRYAIRTGMVSTDE